MKFTEYLEESKENKNVHLEHIEDEVLNRGVAGTRDSINFLRSLRDMLAGHAESKVNVTTKWDGAPAVFCGINPENGKFFVGTKGVLQGDMMFTKGDLKDDTIDGDNYVTFQPNTIVYAVPVDSKLSQMMRAAQIGVVFHTSYTGKKLEDMKASFNIDINNLTTTKDVWFRDASFVDASGTATFTEQETKQITNILSDIGNLFRGINPMVLNRIATTETIKIQIKTFNNSKVRAGQVIGDTFKHVRELTRAIEDKLNKEILSAKLDKTKQKRIAEKSELMRFYRNNATELKKIFDIQNGLVESKSMIIKKLQQIQQVTGTFLRTDTGFKITNAEGFVAVDKLQGNAVKLVDRLEFSQANFNAAKAWSK